MVKISIFGFIGHFGVSLTLFDKYPEYQNAIGSLRTRTPVASFEHTFPSQIVTYYYRNEGLNIGQNVHVTLKCWKMAIFW